MKTMSKSLGFSAKLILIATPMLFNQAYAAYSGDCGSLHLIIAKSIYQKYELSKGSPVVNRGTDSGCDKVDNDTGECADFVFSQVAGQYGPDVDIEFKERNSNETARIRIQQNYCFFEAGDITVEPQIGGFTYKKFPGSYEDDRPGLVTIRSIRHIENPE
ncbi:MAG: hypothetical protein LPD71_12130 [Shewanella sp.]|nr:hypothetical protein [Shewanella sp.]MCF1439453.1 hypothetical protein [Shewanella sp.]MCF1458926.1 hypothetical protein [Shewanella sp.]